MLQTRKNNVTLIHFLTEGEAKLASRRFLPLAVEEFCRRLGVEKKKVVFDENGRPRFFDFSPFDLSVSHCDKLLVFAFAPFPIGVDCEKKGEVRERVARRYFSAEERKMPFSLVWTGKEAVGKLTGKGLSDALRVKVEGDFATLDGKQFSLMRQEMEEYLVTVAIKEE